MEQQLINHLIALICKSGGRPLIQDLLRETDLDGDTKNWTVDEIENAINYLTWINKSFGVADATVIINNLAKDYEINLSHMGHISHIK